MKYLANIDIMPLKELLDPQGKAVTSGLKNLGLQDISNVRIGKHISLEVSAKDKDQAQNQVETACKKLLANQVIESYEYSLDEVE
ncbi:MAG: phosphoribosylformylglycinamidine synthase subunit PurS [Bacteroidia bacterium]|nr:phosphoribosylformylglycinamidine synthase subunit PurS [Bacteroidia bacterium]